MILLFHIFMTVVSLAFVTYMSLHPVKKKLRITYIAVLFSLLSGVMLIFEHPSSLMQISIAEIFYLATVAICTMTANHKLAKTSVR